MDGGHGRTGVRAALSAAALERRLNLRRRAREDGAAGQPPQDALDLSETERAIVTAVADERARLEQQREQARVEAERRMRSLLPPPPDFAAPSLEASLALRQVEGRLAHDWGAVARRAGDARADLLAFKEANGLHRPAVTPSSTLWQAGLLFVAALFESLFSATLFAETDPRGLLGGAVTAIGLSGANVVLGFLAGYVGLRYLQHVRKPIKYAGAAAFALLTAFAIILNGGAAAWRDMLASTPGDSDATASLWSAVLHLHSPQAVVLLMLGGGVWVFAALKGYAKFDDPYPDYGKLDRSAAEAEAELSDLYADARRDLEAPVDAAKALISTRLEQTRAACDAVSKAYDEAALTMQALDAQAQALDETAASAIQLYRQENIAARTLPAPGYFGSEPPRAGPALDALGGAAHVLDEARAILAQAQAASADALKALQAELESVQARLTATSRR